MPATWRTASSVLQRAHCKPIGFLHNRGIGVQDWFLAAVHLLPVDMFHVAGDEGSDDGGVPEYLRDGGPVPSFAPAKEWRLVSVENGGDCVFATARQRHCVDAADQRCLHRVLDPAAVRSRYQPGGASAGKSQGR